MTTIDVYQQLLEGSREFWPWRFWVVEDSPGRAKEVLRYLKRELGFTFEHIVSNLESLRLSTMLIFVFGSNVEAVRKVWERL